MAKRSPIHGYNHNVGYRGILFHVQTEDSGIVNPHIFTHLFHGGVIINTRKVVYDAESDDGVVKSLMQAQHKAIMRELKRGLFDDKIDVYLAAIPGLLPRGSGATEDDPGTGAGINTVAGKQEPAGAAAAAPDEPDAGATETSLPIVTEEMFAIDTLPTVTPTTPLAANASPRPETPPPIPSTKSATIPPPLPPAARTNITKPPPIPSPSSGDIAAAQKRAAAATPPSGVSSISTTTLAGRAATPSTPSPVYATLRGAVPPTAKADSSRPVMPPSPATTTRDMPAAAPVEPGAVDHARPTTSYDTSAAVSAERAMRARSETDVNDVAQVYSPPLPSASEPPGADPQRPGEYSQFKRRDTSSRDSLDTRALEEISDAIPRNPSPPSASVSAPTSTPPTRTASQPVIARPPGIAVDPSKGHAVPPPSPAIDHHARSRSVTAARIAPAGSRPGSSGGVVVSRPAVIVGTPRTSTSQPAPPRTATPPAAQARTATPTASAPRSRQTRENLIRGGAGHDLTAEKSLDDVILAYLAEDQKDR